MNNEQKIRELKKCYDATSFTIVKLSIFFLMNLYYYDDKSGKYVYKGILKKDKVIKDLKGSIDDKLNYKNLLNLSNDCRDKFFHNTDCKITTHIYQYTNINGVKVNCNTQDEIDKIFKIWNLI